MRAITPVHSAYLCSYQNERFGPFSNPRGLALRASNVNMSTQLPCCGFPPRNSGRERIGPFHGEASFPDLRRICRSNARELRSHVVNDVKVAVGTVVVS
jgi:hypothetical protein